MATFSISEVRDRDSKVARALFKSASRVLEEYSLGQSQTCSYDVFLSHAFQDGDGILGIKAMLGAGRQPSGQVVRRSLP
jgi:hypothetical protein